MNREPIVIITAVVTVIIAVLEALPAFAVPVTPEQQEAIKTVLQVLVAGAGAYYARSQVTPVATPRGNDGRVLR